MSGKWKVSLALAAVLVATAAFGQYFPTSNRRDLRAYERGFREGYSGGLYEARHTGPPRWTLDGLAGIERKEFKRGYRAGFHKAKNDRKSGAFPRN